MSLTLALPNRGITINNNKDTAVVLCHCHFQRQRQRQQGERDCAVWLCRLLLDCLSRKPPVHCLTRYMSMSFRFESARHSSAAARQTQERKIPAMLSDIITALIIMCEGVLMYEGLVMFETGSLVTHSCRLFCEVPAEPYSQDLSSPFLPSLLKFWVCVKGGSERLRARCWKCAIGKH